MDTTMDMMPPGQAGRQPLSDGSQQRDTGGGGTGGPGDMAKHRSLTTKPTMGHILEEYADHTTMHGVWRVSQSAYSPFRRGVWVVAMCVGITILLYVFIEQLRIYCEFRVETVLSVHDHAKLEFPAVTLCNYNQFRKTPTLKWGKTGELLKELFSVKNYMDKVQRDTSSESDTPVDYDLTQNLVALAHELNKTVLSATWLNQAVSKDTYFTQSLTEVGVCYTFNSKESRKLHGPLYVHDAGTDSGLTLLMDIENEEYYFGEGSSAGIRVLIHDPDEVPMVGQYGFSVAPGTATSAAIRLTQEIFAKNPYSDCIDREDTTVENPLHFYEQYTQTGCKMEHIVNYVYSVCKCKQYYNPGNLTVCKTPNEVRCAKGARITYFHDGKDYSEEAVRELRLKCRPLCQSFTYDSKLSYASFPAQHLVDELVTLYNYTEEGLRKNVLLLKIYFEDLAIHQIEHRPAYTGVSLFADVGGQMGLCIGASILTVVELVELAIQMVRRFFSPRR